MLNNVTAFSMMFAKREEWIHQLRAYANIPDEQVLKWIEVIDNAAPRQIYAPNSTFAETTMEHVRMMVARGDSSEWIERFIQGLPEGVFVRSPWGRIYELPYPEAESRPEIDLQAIAQRFLDSVIPVLETLSDTKVEDRKRSREDIQRKRRQNRQ